MANQSEQVKRDHSQYLVPNYAPNLVFTRGEGVRLWDANGKEYLDFLAGIAVLSLGHAHPAWVKAVRDQAGILTHVSNLHFHAGQPALAKKLVEKFRPDSRVFFCNSGAEANEAALKICRAHGRRISSEKFEVVALHDSFHGRTMGALSITGQAKYREMFEPMPPGARFIHRNNIAELEQAIGPNTCGIFLELVQGEGGINPLNDDFVRKARELADQHNAMLVFDEIQCGVGRPGTYYSYQVLDPVVMPDVITAAKPIACGLPLAFVAATESASQMLPAGQHGTTYGGGPMTTRVALEFYQILDELLPNIIHVGGYFRMQLMELAKRFSFIKEVRGFGLMIGVEIDFPCKQIILDAMEKGVLLNCTQTNVIRALPPYILTEQDVDHAIQVLSSVFETAKPPSE